MPERYRVTGIFAHAEADVIVFRQTKERATRQARQWSRPPHDHRLQRIEVARFEQGRYRTVSVGRCTAKGWVWAEVANA